MKEKVEEFNDETEIEDAVFPSTGIETNAFDEYQSAVV